MIDLKLMRQYVNGDLSESAINQLKDAQNSFDLDSDEVDEVTMQECAEIGMPLILQAEIMSESCEALEEATVDAYKQLSGYLVGQGYLSEAAAIPTNPKINVVRLNKDAVMKKLTTLYVLTLARRADDPAFKKYKLACALKKEKKEVMFKKYGAKAEKMARQHYLATKGGKVKAVVATAKNTPAKSAKD